MAAPVVWRLHDPAKVGGRATEVLGAPEPVGQGAGEALRFNGRNDGLFVPVNPVAGWSHFTVEVLFKPEGTSEREERFIHVEDGRKARILMETRVTKDGAWALDTFLLDSAKNRLPLLDRTKLHPVGRWYWAALVYDGKTMSSYVDGVKELSGDIAFAPMTEGRVSLGVRQNKVYWFQGCIREVRFTPAALPVEQLQRGAEH